MSDAALDISSLAPCDHEEADTRLFLHLNSAVSQNHQSVVIRSNDSDVLVLAVRAKAILHDKLKHLWIAFGCGKNYR